MEKWAINPTENVNEFTFGTDRNVIRKKLNLRYEEIKKGPFATNTTDFYYDFAIFYDENDKFEAIEFYENQVVEVDGKKVFPSDLDTLLMFFPNLVDDGYGYTDVNNSIGITLNDSNNIETILFGKKDYYTN